MFNLEALVYFTSYHSQDGRKWPITPAGVLDNRCCLCAHIPADALYFDRKINIPEDGYTECWMAESPAELANIAYVAVQKLLEMGVDVIYSVHPRGILIPLVKWRLMRAQDHDKVASKEFLQRLSSISIDLCESFHAPAVLTLEQRSSFGPDVVGTWLDLPSNREHNNNTYEDDVLVELWRRLP